MVIKTLSEQFKHDIRKPIPQDVIPEKIYISFAELKKAKTQAIDRINYFETLLPTGGNLIITK